MKHCTSKCFKSCVHFFYSGHLTPMQNLIEIQKNYLQKIHGPHELGCHMECNDTLRGSESGPHRVLGPKNSKFGPMGPKKIAQKFLYTKLVWYHEVILLGFEAKIVFWA